MCKIEEEEKENMESSDSYDVPIGQSIDPSIVSDYDTGTKRRLLPSEQILGSVCSSIIPEEDQIEDEFDNGQII